MLQTLLVATLALLIVGIVAAAIAVSKGTDTVGLATFFGSLATAMGRLATAMSAFLVFRQLELQSKPELRAWVEWDKNSKVVNAYLQNCGTTAFSPDIWLKAEPLEQLNADNPDMLRAFMEPKPLSSKMLRRGGHVRAFTTQLYDKGDIATYPIYKEGHSIPSTILEHVEPADLKRGAGFNVLITGYYWPITGRWPFRSKWFYVRQYQVYWG